MLSVTPSSHWKAFSQRPLESVSYSYFQSVKWMVQPLRRAEVSRYPTLTLKLFPH